MGDPIKEIEKYVNTLQYLFNPYGTCKPSDIELIIKTGMKIALESYKNESNVSLFGSPYSDELNTKRPDLHNGNTNFYYGMCRVVGREIANGTPENIDEMLKHTVLLKQNESNSQKYPSTL